MDLFLIDNADISFLQKEVRVIDMAVHLAALYLNQFQHIVPVSQFLMRISRAYFFVLQENRKVPEGVVFFCILFHIYILTRKHRNAKENAIKLPK